MYANNEVGVNHAGKEISAIAKSMEYYSLRMLHRL